MFVPATELRDWLIATFLDEGALLFNPDHLHLLDAHLGILWTNVGNMRGGRQQIVGQAEKPFSQGNKWAKARAEFHLVQMFGNVPDFLITLDARFAAEADNARFCSLVEHEMYHCGIALDKWGMPAFSAQTGRPRYSMRPHDAEEFVGVVRRYGVGAAAGGVDALVRAANRTPEIAEVSIASVCGTCQH